MKHLTDYEIAGLQAEFNLADGHAYHSLEELFSGITQMLPEIWYKSDATRVSDAQDAYLDAFGRLIGSDTLRTQVKTRISAGDMIVVQRKSNLDLIGTADRRQSRSFELIRRRIAAYDAVPLSPLLGTTQNIPTDWAQFALDDDNAITLQTFKCPYRNSGQDRNTSRASSL